MPAEAREGHAEAVDRPLRVLVVDDEPLAREGLRLLLDDIGAGAEVIEVRDGLEAVEAIRESRPDLVFLDVQMPEMDGFAVVREVGPQHMPAVVFVTAHDQYAIQAFEVNAIDYLLKPVMRERFAQTLARARERLHADGGGTGDNREMVSLLQSIAAPPKYLTRIAMRTAGRISFVNVDEILWMQAAENYVQLHLKHTRHMLHVPINTLESSLDPAMFLRIHRSFIVNVREIQELETGAHGEYVVVLKGGGQLGSGRTYHDKIKRWAANPF
jgi:two-component system, LytTR family, response regulator